MRIFIENIIYQFRHVKFVLIWHFGTGKYFIFYIISHIMHIFLFKLLVNFRMQM